MVERAGRGGGRRLRNWFKGLEEVEEVVERAGRDGGRRLKKWWKEVEMVEGGGRNEGRRGDGRWFTIRKKGEDLAEVETGKRIKGNNSGGGGRGRGRWSCRWR